jgi:hypothetical protein
MPDDTAPQRHSPAVHPAPPRPRARAGRATAALLTLTAAGLAVGLGAGPARAGGTPQAGCPSNKVTDVSDVNDQLSGGPTHLPAGFYAVAGTFFPPATARLCRTVAGRGHPLVKLGTGTCPAGDLAFGAPNDTPEAFDNTDTIAWGTLLPSGWYSYGQSAPGLAGQWFTVCWSANAPADTR